MNFFSRSGLFPYFKLCGSGCVTVIEIRIRIHKVAENGSHSDPVQIWNKTEKDQQETYFLVRRNNSCLRVLENLDERICPWLILKLWMFWKQPIWYSIKLSSNPTNGCLTVVGTYLFRSLTVYKFKISLN